MGKKFDKIKMSEIYDLYGTIAEFVLPRLKLFKEKTISYPLNMTEKEWDKKLQKMIDAFDLIVKEDMKIYNEKEIKKIEKGLKLFAKYFRDLWI